MSNSSDRIGALATIDAIMNARIFITRITNAVDPFLDRQRAVGTLPTEAKHPLFFERLTKI
jgi:hypothetical protein